MSFSSDLRLAVRLPELIVFAVVLMALYGCATYEEEKRDRDAAFSDWYAKTGHEGGIQ